MRTVISGVAVVLPDRLAAPWTVAIAGGRVDAAGPDGSVAARAGDRVVEAGGQYLAPGFIDLHIHGARQWLAEDGPEALDALLGVLPGYGVTGVLPTLAPRPEGEDAELLGRLAAVCAGGAQVLGFHLEGPFLAVGGAIGDAAMTRPSRRRVEALMAAARPHRAVFTIAPEVEGVLEVIGLMAREGAPVFISHTRADVRQTQAAIEAGARHATHFYDVFPCPPETEPGVRPCGAVEAILADPRVSVDFILDGEHVDPVAVKLALACKRPDRVCLATDANVGAGLGAGRYQFAGQEIVISRPGAAPRLGQRSHAPGALAGSGLTMDRAVRNAVELLGLDLPQAVRMASANPAAVLGLAGRKGRVQPGFDADLVLLDAALRVTRTWIGGEEWKG